MKKIRILLADDHKIILELMAHRFKNHPEIEVIGTATDGNWLLSMLRENMPDVAVLDISMPGMDGVATTKEIRKLYPELPILIFSSFGEREYIRQFRGLGISGYVLKMEEFSELENAILALAKGEKYFSRKIDWLVPHESPEEGQIHFTKREQDVLDCLANGMDAEGVAQNLNVKRSTIDSYTKSIRAKTGLHHAGALVNFAKENGYGTNGCGKRRS